MQMVVSLRSNHLRPRARDGYADGYSRYSAFFVPLKNDPSGMISCEDGSIYVPPKCVIKCANGKYIGYSCPGDGDGGGGDGGGGDTGGDSGTDGDGDGGTVTPPSTKDIDTKEAAKKWVEEMIQQILGAAGGPGVDMAFLLDACDTARLISPAVRSAETERTVRGDPAGELAAIMQLHNAVTGWIQKNCEKPCVEKDLKE